MKVVVTKYLNARVGAPSVNATVHTYLEPGSTLEVDGALYQGDVYDGNNFWFRDNADNYYWSGGVSLPEISSLNTFSTPTKFIDFHCHSSLKPYSKSFKRKRTQGKNTLDDGKKHSIWFKTDIDILKKIGNAVLFGITKFTQADFTSAFEGGARVMMVSIDPMERELVLSKRKRDPIFGGFILDFIQGIGKKRMKYLRKLDDYFADLKDTYDYLDQLQHEKKVVGGKTVAYKLVNVEEEIDFTSTDTIHIVPTVEGGHVFRSSLNSNLTSQEIEDQVLANVDALKMGFGREGARVTPFFVSLAHHFRYGLCGFADSLAKAKLAYNQDTDKDECITSLGNKVVERLLSTEHGRRVLIDVKHMNLKSRVAYYNNPLRKAQNIPIIVSHGATNVSIRASAS